MTWSRIREASTRVKKRIRAVTFVAAAAALVAGLTLAAVGGASAAPHAAAQAPSCTSGTTVQTKDGPVCGITADSITSYLDIPYA
jgi:para-nitrobenzyl esterase